MIYPFEKDSIREQIINNLKYEWSGVEVVEWDYDEDYVTYKTENFGLFNLFSRQVVDRVLKFKDMKWKKHTSYFVESNKYSGYEHRRELIRQLYYYDEIESKLFVIILW